MSEEKKQLRDMETPFIFKEYDKFEKKSTWRYWPLSDNSLLNSETSIEDDPPGINDSTLPQESGFTTGLSSEYSMRIRSVKVEEKEEIFVLDYFCMTSSFSKESPKNLSLKDGDVKINLNDATNLELNPIHPETNSLESVYSESGSFLIDRKQLKQIGDAKKVGIKVSGSGVSFVWKDKSAQDFQDMIRCFYNNVVDKQAYCDTIKVIMDKYKKGVLEGLVQDQDIIDKYLSDEVTLDEAVGLQNERIEAQKQKETEEKQQRVQKRRKLIEEGTPEINYDKYQEMQKAKTTQMVVAGIAGVVLLIVYSWWLGLIVAGVAYVFFENKYFSQEKIIDVFGEEIAAKYDNNFGKLDAEYKDDIPSSK